MAGVKTVYNDIKKSQEDKRDYRGLLLDNQMKVLLISDPTTDKSSAALRVDVGYMCDPPELPGLAHFCEHMLFLGTSKYPDEQDYRRYLSENGGTHNASTSPQCTTYYFDVAPEGLQGQLDRFAQFFICPLFTESATKREVNAVNSESEKNIKLDAWRLFQVEKMTYDQGHPFSNFGVGNFDTLMTHPREAGIDTRQALLDFHSRYYSANIMTLTVLGKETLDELQTFVTDLFTSVENKDVVVKDWEGHPLGDKQIKHQLTVVPVKNLRSLTIQWPLPDLHEHYKMKPGSYFSHLLGHEGPGSIYSEIKNLGWATGLSAGSLCYDGFGFFKVLIDLSEEGLDHTTDIVTLIFQYIKMLKEHGPQQWIQDEKKELNAMAFRFKDKEQPRSHTINCTSYLHDYPMSEVLSGDYLIEEYDPEVIRATLDHLRPDNCRIITSAKKFEGQTDLTETRYRAPYTNQPMGENLIEMWTNCSLHPNLHLPVKNEFIPSMFDLVKQVDKVQQPELDKDQQKQEVHQILVEDALSYLDQVKLQFGNQTQVYNDLLDIMKALKTQMVSAPDAVVQVCNLFKGYPDLIGGFSKFLPAGYKVEVHNNETIQLQQPGGDTVSVPVDELAQITTNNKQTDKPIMSSLEPRLVQKTDLMELWHRQDDVFLLPKACVTVAFLSPEVYKSAESMNLTAMLERLFVDSLNEYLYAAELAGLHYDLVTLRTGFKVTLDGYNDKLKMLLQKVLDRLVNMKVDPDRFSVIKEKYIRGLQNYEAEQPYSHASYYTDVFLAEVMWTQKEKLAQAPSMTVSDLQAFIPRLLSALYLKMLVYGNVDKEGAVDLANVLTCTLERRGTTALPTHLQPRSQAVHLPDGVWFGLRVENSVHATNALKVYYQVGMESIRDNILLELLAQINKQPCFDTLRTQEQLGKGIKDNAYRRPKVFRRYEDGYIVREMLPEDARIIQNWYCGMSRISPYDLNITLQVFPKGRGFYVGELDGVVVASALRIPWSDEVFYGSMYYVEKEYRGAGYGTRLRDQVARDYVGDNILCVDAEEGKVAKDNKAKFGYEYAGFNTSRYMGVAKASYDDLPEFKDGKIVKAPYVPLDDIVAYDNKCFICADNPIRRAFLEKWLHIAGGASYVALDSSHQVVGYGQRRPCFQEGDHIVGPLYADSAEIVNALLQHLCRDVAGDRISIHVWQLNKVAVEMVSKFEMMKLYDVIRMHVNGNPKEYKDSVFAVTSIYTCGF